jgi:hypothetical protein
MTLTQEERDKFATWLEEEAVSAKQLAEQAQKLAPPLAEKLRAESLSASIIARKLRATVTLGVCG